MILKRLRESREDLDLKQKDIAKKLGISYSTVSGWETGKDTIPLTQLIKYANCYNLSLDFLFSLSNDNKEYSSKIKIDLEIIGKNLRKIRKAHNKTQQNIADILNTSQSAYAHYENGLNLIPTAFLYSLTKYYKNISVDEIFGRK